MEVVLLGSGTLSKLIIDILNFQEKIRIKGIYDDTYKKGSHKNGYEILGNSEDIFKSRIKNVIICIGNQKLRKLFFNRLSASQFSFPKIIAHNAVISKNSVIEDGCIVGFFSTVLYDTYIGKSTYILNNVSVNHNTKINDFGLIGAGAVIGNDCILEEGVHVGMGKAILPSAKISAWEYIS